MSRRTGSAKAQPPRNTPQAGFQVIGNKKLREMEKSEGAGAQARRRGQAAGHIHWRAGVQWIVKNPMPSIAYLVILSLGAMVVVGNPDLGWLFLVAMLGIPVIFFYGKHEQEESDDDGSADDIDVDLD